MKSSHRLAARFVIRAPVLPFAALAGLAADPRGGLRALLDDAGIREALFVASPGLAAQLDEWRTTTAAEPALERSLIRYIARMASRATPFGLFSGVACGDFGPTTHLALAPRAAHRRHTRLDNEYLAKLCDKLVADPALRAELTFVPSSSLYRSGDRWRYAESRIGEIRSYHLVAVEVTDHLDAVLDRARDGATLAAIGDMLAADPELARDEIEDYLTELVAAQVLVPTLAPRVTGAEPSTVVTEMLAALPSGRATATILSDTTRRLAAIDDAHGAPPDAYRAIARDLAALPVEVDLARLFQADLHVAMPEASLGPRVVTALEQAFALVKRLAPPRPTTDAWSKFREAFATRYETREVPLVEVLDEESGIGFGDAPADLAQAPLVHDLAFPGRFGAAQVAWSGRNARLVTLIGDAARAGALEIELTAADIDALAAPTEAVFADTVHLGATLIASSAEAIDRGEFQLRLNGLGGASATRMLGRFCHGSPEITALVGELVAHEQAAATDAIFAEVVHLPEGRVGNILLRPVLRAYEIPYLGASGAEPDRQLAISDLLVSVSGDRVVLRSRRLGKEVRPRMATAHNYTMRSLAIYRFLCSHETQHTTSSTWSWGVLEDMPFLPRVRHGNLILSRARWLLRKPDLDQLAKTRERRRLPRWVVVADGDHEMPIDLDNPIAVESFQNLVKGRSFVGLVELLPDPDQLAVHGPEGRHAHELVVPFVCEAFAAVPPMRVAPVAVVRRFAPGSEWLYAKLYAGTASAETVLREVVAPLVRDTLARGVADRFFFIRYTDPDHHLRLRFHGDPRRLAGELLPALHACVEPAIARGLVWRMQLDTYEREVERYGGDQGIELGEALFAADSEAVLAIVDDTAGDRGAQARWRLAACGLDLLMADLGLDLPARLALTTSLRDSFGAEMGMDTAFQRRLGDKFRTVRVELAAMIAGEPHPAFVERSHKLAPIAAALRTAPLERTRMDLVGSYLHMHVNRMLASLQRRQELVLYDFLRRHYDGVRARAR